MPPLAARIAHLAALAAACPQLAGAQGSQHALRFHGTGAGQQDRARLRIDDDQPGPDASAACDIGVDSFSIEMWVRGTLADNPAPGGAGDASYADERWRDGHVVLDRGIAAGSEREFGLSFAGGHVRFGTGRGDGPGADAAPNTLEGDRVVLDGTWHHVAAVRYHLTGQKAIYVDGALDVASAGGTSLADLTYPDLGVPSASAWDAWLVLGAEKTDAQPGARAFRGLLDEVRLWRIARSSAAIGADMHRVIPPDTPQLVASYRFEEGAGTATADASVAGSPVAEVVAGVPGNGEWTDFAADPHSCAPIQVGSLPTGFERSLVASGLVEPTDLVIADYGRIFVAQRDGAIRVVQGGALLAAPLVTLPVDLQSAERGLFGLALDPAFAQNGWLYAFRTTPEPRDRVSRFTVVGTTASLSSELVVWEHPALAAGTHQGGGLAFGGEEHLFVAIGDQGDGASAQSLASVGGKLLRLRRDGTIPPDNPFVATPGARPEIWARGLRNPFRVHHDRVHMRVWIGNVGSNGADSWEELEAGAAGANFGWPLQEGPNCFSAPCTGIATPAYAWRHDDPAFAPGYPQGCIVAGPVYDRTQFPVEYRGNVFVADYANRWIRRLVLDAAGAILSSHVFVPAPEAGPVVALRVGPDGALYYVTYGVPWMPPVEASRIWRVAYTGSGNVAPIAVARASRTSGLPPQRIAFEGGDSSDPDGGPGPLAWHWDFGDGATSDAASSAHTYAQEGVYDVVLTVSDGASSTAAEAIRVRIGHPPVAALLAPLDGASYRAGDTIDFAGWAEDVEDGVLTPSAFTWQVLLVHAAHTHPFFGPTTGVAAGSFTIPVTGHAPAETQYEVVLVVRDSDGLDCTRSARIRPETAPVAFTTVPPGIALNVDGEPRATPFATESLVGFRHRLVAPARIVHAGQAYGFQRWTDGQTSAGIEWVAPVGGGALRALYRRAP